MTSVVPQKPQIKRGFSPSGKQQEMHPKILPEKKKQPFDCPELRFAG